MKRLIKILLLSGTALWFTLGHADEEFKGIVESRPEGKVGTWMIGGRQVVVTERTRLKEEAGPLVVGACAEVEYKGDFVEEIESEEKADCGK